LKHETEDEIGDKAETFEGKPVKIETESDEVKHEEGTAREEEFGKA